MSELVRRGLVIVILGGLVTLTSVAMLAVSPGTALILWLIKCPHPWREIVSSPFCIWSPISREMFRELLERDE